MHASARPASSPNSSSRRCRSQCQALAAASGVRPAFQLGRTGSPTARGVKRTTSWNHQRPLTSPNSRGEEIMAGPLGLPASAAGGCCATPRRNCRSRPAPLDGGWLRRCASSSSASTSLRAAAILAPAGIVSSSPCTRRSARCRRRIRGSPLATAGGSAWRSAATAYRPPWRAASGRTRAASTRAARARTACTETAAPTPHAERPAYIMTLRDPGAVRVDGIVCFERVAPRRTGDHVHDLLGESVPLEERARDRDDFRNRSAARHREAVKEYRERRWRGRTFRTGWARSSAATT